MINLFGSKGKKWDVNNKDISKAVPGYNREKVADLAMTITLGLNTLVEDGNLSRAGVAKFIHDNAHDLNVCVVLADMFVLGVGQSQTDFFISAVDSNPKEFRELLKGQEEDTKEFLRSKITMLEKEIEGLHHVIDKL